MKLRNTPSGLIAQSSGGEWISLVSLRQARAGIEITEQQTTDMVAFLSAGDEFRKDVAAAVDGADQGACGADPAEAVLPFRPRSMRAFMLWEEHVIASSRALVKNFFPPSVAKVMEGRWPWS